MAFDDEFDTFPAAGTLHLLNTDGTTNPDPPAGDYGSQLLGQMGVAIRALEEKVGLANSADTTSHDYLITQILAALTTLDVDFTAAIAAAVAAHAALETDVHGAVDGDSKVAVFGTPGGTGQNVTVREESSMGAGEFWGDQITVGPDGFFAG